jgi:hypothetical protein
MFTRPAGLHPFSVDAYPPSSRPVIIIIITISVRFDVSGTDYSVYNTLRRGGKMCVVEKNIPLLPPQLNCSVYLYVVVLNIR